MDPGVIGAAAPGREPTLDAAVRHYDVLGEKRDAVRVDNVASMLWYRRHFPLGEGPFRLSLRERGCRHP